MEVHNMFYISTNTKSNKGKVSFLLRPDIKYENYDESFRV